MTSDRELRSAPWLLACRLVGEQQYVLLRMAEVHWQRCFQMQDHLMREWLGFLAENHPCRRRHVEMASGPDIMDHYGRRAHDVDVERI